MMNSRRHGLSADEYLEDFPEETQALASQLRALIRRTVPDVREVVSLGWQVIQCRAPAKGRDVYFAFLGPKMHPEVTLGFEWGVLLDDPDQLLIGSELKQVRYLTLRAGEPVPEHALARLIEAAARVASLSQREKQQRLIEQEEIARLERGR